MSKWITINETARYTGFSRQWVHKRIDDGTFKSEKQGSHVNVDADSVQEWMVKEMGRMQDRWKFYYHHLPNGYHGQPKID